MFDITPQEAITLYTEIAAKAIPIAFVFGMCNVLVNIVFSAAFGGRLSLGGGRGD